MRQAYSGRYVFRQSYKVVHKSCVYFFTDVNKWIDVLFKVTCRFWEIQRAILQPAFIYLLTLRPLCIKSKHSHSYT